ncbi:hypothetical protein [Streptomyces sp. Ac-502]|uniref:hypothetical protein n=1 Tax=Streptomyces sp. Ac-502 TaxID=3342801 RepID=UPI0038627C89
MGDDGGPRTDYGGPEGESNGPEGDSRGLAGGGSGPERNGSGSEGNGSGPEGGPRYGTLLRDAWRLLPQITAVRREIHRAPELGTALPRTQQTVLRELSGLP